MMFNKKPRIKASGGKISDRDAQRLEMIIATAKMQSIASCVFMFQADDGQTIVRVENIQFGTMLELLVTAFRNAVSLEKERNPNLTKEQEVCLDNLLSEFNVVIERSNERFKALNAKMQKEADDIQNHA